MHVYTLRCEMVAPIPIAEVFRVFEDPSGEIGRVVRGDEPAPVGGGNRERRVKLRWTHAVFPARGRGGCRQALARRSSCRKF